MRNTKLHDKKNGSQPNERAIAETERSSWQLPENESRELLLFSKSVTAVRDRYDLRSVLDHQLKTLFGPCEIYISLFDHKQDTQTHFLNCSNAANCLLPLLENNAQAIPIRELTDLTMISEAPLQFYITGDRKSILKIFDDPDTNNRSLVTVSLQSGNQTIGVMYIAWYQVHHFNTPCFDFIRGLADQLSISIANILANEEILKKEQTNSVLLSLSNAIATIRNKSDLFEVIDQKLKRIIPYDDFVICLINEDQQTHSPFLYNRKKDFQSQPGIAPTAEAIYSLDDGLCRRMMLTETPIIFDVDQLMQWPDVPVWMGFWHEMGIKEMTAFAITVGNECIGFFYLYARARNVISEQYYALLKSIGLQISVAIANILANEKIEQQLQEINAYKHQLEEEKSYLKEHLEITYHHNEIVGSSLPLKKVFHMVEQVAHTASTVLILGETGTGKELIARALHNGSPRKEKLMIKLNCATLPPHLIESELFGHERGSFTGATEKRIGKFELAHNSTLFLDEIGELPPDLQVKLLRALQEREIERVGGRSVIKIDVRIIAATNRNLLKEVQAGTFRSDLYYRLNVFPIILPPLRERQDDIPTLASHFAHRYARKAGKNIKGISQQVLKMLTNYTWPGNIRELEHLMERSVLLTTGTAITEVHLPNIERTEQVMAVKETRLKSLEENERDHIMAMLKLCKGKISGIGGAADLLEIPATTLNSKLKKLNIKREHTLS